MDVRALRHVFGINRRSAGTNSPSKFHFEGAFEPLPPPTGNYPFRLDLEDVLGRPAAMRIAEAGKWVFHCVGDTGNRSHGADAQDSVAFHMEEQVNHLLNPDGPSPEIDTEGPSLFYHLGDVVYFNGERERYEGQFYDPYLHYPPPIVAIAGNHDGATVPGGDPSLLGFMENFCAAQPQHTWMAGQSNRTTMIQPNVYWTFKTPLATIIGLYSNVSGQLDQKGPTQENWLTSELTAAAADKPKCILVAVHHPPYSLDDTHGGHVAIREALDRAFAASGVTPTAVLTGHVHNYQRFERRLNGRHVPYVVAGAGGFAGYSKLHQLKTTASPEAGVKLVAHETKLPGFLRLTVTAESLEGEYFAVPRPPRHMDPEVPAQSVDRFSVPL